MTMDETLNKRMQVHEDEMHAFDEDIRTALFGPMKKPIEGYGRISQKGLVHQVEELHDNMKNTGIKAKLSGWDKAAIGLIVAIVEVARIVLG